MKICSNCKVPKDESLFYKRGDRSGHYSSWCKDCSRKCTEDRWKVRVAAGLCKCGRERTPGYQSCSFCRKPSASKRGAGRKANRKIRNEVIAGYGGKCACCGESENLYLQLHHINNDGKAHRKELGGNFRILYWAKKNNYPKILELLCANCHAAITTQGYCPHQVQLQWVA